MSRPKSQNTESAIPSVPFLRIDKKCYVILDIQVIPNASRTQADGLYGELAPIALKVRLAALPVDGMANEALVKWLAEQLGISRKSLEVVRGKTARRKQVRLSAETAAQADWHRLCQHKKNQSNAIK